MQQLNGKAVVNQTVDLDIKSVRKSGVVADGSLTSWLYVHWDTLKDFIRRITGINNVIRVKAVFTSNITIGASGSSVDGYTLLNGDVVLVAGQTDSTQNGLYTWATGGALTRLAPFTSTFAAGLAILNIALQGRIFHVLNGNINRNTFWYFDSPTQFPVIGTSSLLFYNVANLKVSSASNNLIIQGTDGIEVKLKNTGTVNGGADAVFGGLQYDAVTKEFYIITSLMPGASGSLTIENSAGTVLGVASKQRFSAEFVPTWDGANSRITVALAAGLGVQVGTVVYEAFDTVVNPSPPLGYLLCNGQQITRALYPDLCTKLGLTFATAPNITLAQTTDIPNMTSNSQAGYITSASTTSTGAGGDSFAVNGVAAWKAFNTSTTDYWLSANTTFPHYLQIQLPSAKAMNNFKLFIPPGGTDGIAGAFGAEPTPTSLNIEGSNDGTTWFNILSSTTQPSNAGVLYTSANITAYLYYRLKINASNVAQRSFISKFELYPQQVNQTNVPTTSNLQTGVRAIIKT